MKLLLLTLSLFSLLATASHAVGINIGQTAGAARFFSTLGAPGTPLANTATIQLGWMSDPTDASTFVAFGTSNIHGNTVFTTGVGTLADNSVSPSLTLAAGKSYYILVYSGASLATSTAAGIWKTTTATYPADLAPAGATPASASLSADVWSVVSPTTNWNFLPATYVADTAPIGLSDAQVTPTARTGDAFTLGAAVPEPSSLALLGLIGLVGLRRKR